MKKELIFGIHSVTSKLENNLSSIISIFIQKNIQNKQIKNILSIAKRHKIPIETISKEKLNKLTKSFSHQGIAMFAQKEKELSETDLFSLIDKLDHDPFLLILDNIQDPQNLGACIRSANAAGVDAVIIPKNNSAKLNETVRKVASGACDFTPLITVTNITNTIKKLKDLNIWIYGTTLKDNSTNIYETSFAKKIALVMGSESKGIRNLTEKNCDFLIHIPMKGKIESLNISAAAAISMFEIAKHIDR